jgi:hypothetical protein
MQIDHDGQQSRETRGRLFADCVEREILLIGTHFVAPTAGYVSRAGEGFRFGPGEIVDG